MRGKQEIDDSMESWIQNIPLLQAGYHLEMLERVAELGQHQTIYPPSEQIFRALQLTAFEEVKVVLLGQDPYHRPGQAQGLAFSVPEGAKVPPSLCNIFKEIATDLYDGDPAAFSPNLSRWAEQGVLLLNAALTVEAGKAGSHQKLGWQRLTDQIVAQLSHKREHLVFMLWGNHARPKRPLIAAERHLILEAAHPSPFSARQGFFGCRHFSQANAYLKEHGGEPIRW